jgi:predicted HicB family RNase H-like nuclease
MARNAENEARKQREQAAGLVGTMVRLPEDLWVQAKHLAANRRSSLNAEIQEALRKHLEEARRESQSR